MECIVGITVAFLCRLSYGKYKRTHIIKKNSTDTCDKSLHFDMPVLMHCCMLHTFIVETMLAKHSSNDTFH